MDNNPSNNPTKFPQQPVAAITQPLANQPSVAKSEIKSSFKDKIAKHKKMLLAIATIIIILLFAIATVVISPKNKNNKKAVTTGASDNLYLDLKTEMKANIK